MTPDSRAQALRMVGALLPGLIGSDAVWRIYDRGLRTPMNFVLDEADRQLGQESTIVWVDGGFPEVFTLTGLPVVNAVYSTRYVELSAFVRTLLVQSGLGQSRKELAERAALKVMAELLLRSRQSDLACRCFLRSIVDKTWLLNDYDVLADLEVAKINESYMAIWFFGLVHELGHNHAMSGDSAGFLTDDRIEQELRYILAKALPAIQAPLTAEEALIEVRNDPGHPLSAGNLRGEIFADMFSAQVLMQSTIDILTEIGGERFNPAVFIAEMATYVNVLSFLERCKMTTVAVTSTSARQKPLRLLLQPAGYAVRTVFLRWYVGNALEQFYRGDAPPEPERTKRWGKMVMDVSSSFGDQIDDLEFGLARAMEFAFSQTEANDDLFRRVTEQLTGNTAALLAGEVRNFCALARSVGVSNDQLDALADLTSS